ncbi:pav [Cordylochernes scorpioides]|uniref:Kinesin-like protein n=1 Tax=Cordylochernes scorpioides TaxID=51811 RepID=A0ABY6JXU8_9ARAC|nr:pav [Cordylochernes scorpioides]
MWYSIHDNHDRCCTDEVQPDQEPEPRDSLHPAQVSDPGSGGGVLSDAAGREPGGHPQCQSPQFHHHPAGSTGRISRHQEWNGQGARVDVTYVLLCVQLQYVFKKVFDDHVSQKDIFDHVAKPLVQDLIAGKNGRLGCPRGECADSWVVPGLLFTYGITSSGKTFTMTGVPRDAGILPRSLDVLFNSLKDQLARKFVRTLLLYTASFLSNSGTLGKSRVTIQEISLVFAIMAFTTWKKDADLDWSQRQSEECMVEGVDSDCVYGVFVSYVEIYNNYVYDLLEESGETGSKLLREDAGKRVYVFGATEVEVRNAGEAMEALCRGQIRRRVANTALNAESSRSHSIFSVRVVRCPLDARGAEPLPDKNLLTLAQLSLVDLAGSERTARTGTAGNRLKEASHDNHVHVVQAMIIMVGRSRRLFLLTCIEILRENQMENANKEETKAAAVTPIHTSIHHRHSPVCPQMVPYRESKLTHLFKSYFEGEGSIKMVVCVNPKPSDYDETIHVMKFAELTQEVLVERHAPPPTPQLQSGRGNRFREVARRVKEEAELQQLLTPAVYSLGPPFPDFTELTEESQFDTLIDILEQRYQSGKFLTKDLPAKRKSGAKFASETAYITCMCACAESELRKCIHETEKENLTMQQQFTVLQMNLEAREIQVRTLEKKLSSVEHSKDILSRKMEESERNQRNLKNLLLCFILQLEEQDMQIKQSSTESNKMKTKFQDRLAMERERMNRIMVSPGDM